jgi:stage II sporulation protein D
MRDRGPRAALVALPLVAALTLPAALSLPGAAAAADVQATVGAPAEDAPAPEDVAVPTDPVDLGVVAAPLRFAAGPGVAIALADGRRYLDTLELRSPGDGQVLVNDLTLDDYTAGVAEMPGRWHLEALKAQAVAARTYAWHQLQLGTFDSRGYDICDTVDCQAFAGASQEEGEQGDRWRRAVDETAGQVLLDEAGDPILARYFSTSGGRTLPNEVVFPRSGPRPYLVGVDDPGDEVSPYHRWEVTFSREEFDSILARGETLGATVPVAAIERLGEIDEPGADLRVTGADGTEVVVDSVDLRTFVSTVARELYPDRFPTARSDGLRPLPSTLPSSRFTVDVGDDEVVVTGRGWGHGVGMGQYGARGRAEAGDDHATILAAYYNGLEPVVSDAAPERIRVGLSLASVGSVTPDAPMAITAGGDTVVEAATGTWTVAGEGGGVRLSGPPGWGQPAAASRTEEAIGVPTLPRAIAVEAVTAVPGAVALEVTTADGEVVLERAISGGSAGRHVAVWDLNDADGEPVPPGDYLAAVTVTAADGSTAGSPLPVRVDESPGPLAALTGEDGASSWWAVPVVLVVGLVGLAAAGAALGRRRDRRARARRRAAARTASSAPMAGASAASTDHPRPEPSDPRRSR